MAHLIKIITTLKNSATFFYAFQRQLQCFQPNDCSMQKTSNINLEEILLWAQNGPQIERAQL